MRTHSYLRMSCAILLGALSSGCEKSDDKPENIASEGVSLRIRADLPVDQQQASVAASAYLNGQLRPLVGGDIFYARNTSQQRELRYTADVPGLYQNSLDDNNSGTEVIIDIRFEPDVARNQRWYPSDLLKVESQAGRLVGYSARGVFPPSVRINEPLPDTTYRSRTDEAIVSWNTTNDNYQAEVISIAACHSGVHSSSFTKKFTTTDNGSFTLQLEQALPQSVEVKEDVKPGGIFFPLYRSLGVPFLDIVTFGLFSLKSSVTHSYPIEYCSLELKLFRIQIGQLGSGVNGGSVTMSRSDSVNVRYEP